MPRNFGFKIKQDQNLKAITGSNEELLEMGTFMKLLWKYINKNNLKVLKKDL